MSITPEVAAKTLSQRVATEIKVQLVLADMRQSDLARQIGRNEQWLSVRLRGIQPIDLNDVELIATALRVPVLDLIQGASSRPAGTPAKVRDPNASSGRSGLSATIPPPNGQRTRARHDRGRPAGHALSPIMPPRRGSTRPGRPIDPRERRPMPMSGPFTPMPHAS